MRGIAYRRHHKNRMKDKAVRVAKDNGWAEKTCLNCADNLAECSCYMCGNPRRQKFREKDKLTIQERVQNEREFNYDLSEKTVHVDIRGKHYEVPLHKVIEHQHLYEGEEDERV